MSIALIFFIALGSVCAVDTNVSNNGDSNLIQDNIILSSQNLEVSSEDSISDTNSHDDNLEDYPVDGVLKGNANPNYEDNYAEQQLSGSNVVNDVSSDVLGASSDSSPVSAKKTTTLTIANTHYNKIAKFQVTLKEGNNGISGQKVALKINGKTYYGTTGSNGVATISTEKLSVGTYTATASYGGNSNYASSSKTVSNLKVLSSISASDYTKGYGYIGEYTATFYKDAGALVNTKVTFTINGKSYTRTTNSKGVLTIPIGLGIGKYTLSMTNPVSGEKVSKSVVVTKDSTTIESNYKTTYVPINSKYTYTVTLKSKNNVALKGQTVYFKFNGKQVTAVTNSNGKASLTIPALSKGTYSISYNFKGNNYYYASSGSGTIIVQDSTTKFTSSALKSAYNDGSKFKVKVTNSAGKAITGKNVKFTINGVNYIKKTDSNGYASIGIGLAPGSYNIYFSYSLSGLPDYKTSSNKINVAKQTASLTAGDLTMKGGTVKNYQVTVKDIYGKALKSVKVKFTINGKSYTKTTNSKGAVSFPIGLGVGNYKATSQVVDNKYYTSKSVAKNVLVDGIKFIASDKTTTGKSITFSVKLVNGKSNPIKGATVKFTFNGKTQSAKSDSSGVAKVSLTNLNNGVNTVKYSSDSYSGSSKIYVGTKVSISQIIASSKNVRNYIEVYGKLPSSVKIGSTTYTTPQYLYAASQAIINLKKGSTSDVFICSVKAPTKPGAASNLGNLYDYLSVAKSVVSSSDSKGVMPNSVNSKVGNIGYNGLVYAFSRVVAFYGENSKTMPSYVTIKTYSSSGASGYLAATANCQVNDPQIRALAARLTSGLTSDWDKARAIYNYVRDSVSYSFYYNTKYGAVGTLNAKTGNCVDQSHLCNALFRASGLKARYVHGTCTFNSGTYGHVWSQVYLNGQWVVADATSSRNSLGNHVNWNSGSIHGYYISLSF